MTDATEMKPRARKARAKPKKFVAPKIEPGQDFWIVMRIEKKNPQTRFTYPTVKHASFGEANREAVRLAKSRPGLAFAVLKLEVVHHVKPEKGSK